MDVDDALLEHGHAATGRSLLQAKKGELVLSSLVSIRPVGRLISGLLPRTVDSPLQIAR